MALACFQFTFVEKQGLVVTQVQMDVMLLSLGIKDLSLSLSLSLSPILRNRIV